MDLNETICFCADVTAGDIKKAYDEGHTTVDAIGEATEAGTHCGGCQDRMLWSMPGSMHLLRQL